MRDLPRVVRVGLVALATLSALSAGALAPSVATAQISPGPLSRAHASLDLQLGCTQCHGGRKEPVSQRCLACHREVDWQRQQQRGYHARDGRGECASCHPEHAGRDFALIKWPQGSAERFRHDDTGWPLEGKHADVKCVDCHKAAFRVSAAAPLAPRQAALHWIGLEQRCASCHEDPHRAALGDNCTRCHDMKGWKPAAKFEHANTRYPLTGKHADVECAKCHAAARLHPRADSVGKPIPTFKPVPFSDCSSCHSDPHQGRLKGQCSSCHVTSSFQTIGTGSFDHSKTRYPLQGKHAAVECAQCHQGYPRAVNRPAFATCTGCHRDPHAGGATLAGRVVDCAACHRVSGFTPATFTVAQHDSTAYPLRGRHALAPCAECHQTHNVRGARVVDIRPPHAACTDCHVDPHGAAFARGAACQACHDYRAFSPSTLDVAAHGQYGWALTGAHRAVPCVECHKELRRPSPRRARATLRAIATRDSLVLTFATASTCAACHASPHGSQFDRRPDRGACDACHTTDVFRPAARFDHDRDAAFPLKPAHVKVPCGSCHVASPDPKAAGGLGPVVYHGTVARCEQCHSGARARP